MHDQADNLRQLVQRASSAPTAAPAGIPLVAVTGCRAEVGATTVAVNLAAVLADAGIRVLALDVAQERPRAAEVAAVRAGEFTHHLSEVLSGKCGAREAIVSGPAGMSLLANRSARRSDFSRHAQQRLLTELQSLRGSIDLIVADIGTGLSPWTRRFWLRASVVILVTTSETQSLLDAYATVKQSVADALGPDVRLLMNRCVNERAVADAQERIAAAAQRFLGRGIPALPSLPTHIDDDTNFSHDAPRVWRTPNSPFGHAMLWLGRAVNDALEIQTASMTASAAA